MAGAFNQADVDNLSSLDDAYALAGIDGKLNTIGDTRFTAHHLLDLPQEYDDIAMLPEESLRTHFEAQEPPLGLRLVSRIYKLRNICVMESKSSPGNVLALLQVQASSTTSSQVVLPVQTNTLANINVSGLRLDVLVNPSNKSNLAKLSDIDIAVMFDRYTMMMGAAPAPELEPSSEQPSAVNQLIVGGDSPYVDFSIFVPFGRRFLKKLSMQASHFVPELGTRKQLNNLARQTSTHG